MSQFLRPSSDISNAGGWTPSPLWAELDETSPDDDTSKANLVASTGGTRTFEVGLAGVADPYTHSGHILKTRHKHSNITGCTVTLKQGGVTIASFSPTAGSVYETDTYTLSAGEAAAITNYSALSVLYSATNVVAAGADVTWIELEVPNQFGRPISTITPGNWGVSGAPTRHEALDEETPNDATDYATTTPNGVDTLEVLLAPLSDPASSTGHVIRARVRQDLTGGFGTMTAFLYQGITQLVAFDVTPTADFVWQTFTHTLTGPQADSITDYTNLRLRVVVEDLIPGGITFDVSWLEFEVPGGSGGPPPPPPVSMQYFGEFDAHLSPKGWF